MSQGGLHSLATIIKRLEAATSRLEDIALASADPSSPRQVSNAESFTPPPLPLPPVPPPALPALPAVDSGSDETHRSVEAFDESVVEATLKPFVELTKTFAGPLVTEQVSILEKEFANLRSILLMASMCSRPDEETIIELFGPLRSGIEGIVRIKNSKRSEWDNHLSMIAEGIQAVGWVTVAPKPGPFIGEMKDSAQFYGNRVIKEFKEKDSKHVEWVKGYVGILEALRKYVMDFHTTGLLWNAKGVSVANYNLSAAVPSLGPPPPPPPPPPLPSTDLPKPPNVGGAAAVFAEINRGEAVTKGLRKVDKSEMTHKNPELRAGGTVPTSATTPLKKPAKPSKPPALAGKKPSKFALEGSKWVIEYYENDPNLIVDNVDISQTVSLYGCKSVTVQIKGKINAVTLVNCLKTSLLVDSVISSVSITSSPSFALQITGKAPTIQLDSTDYGQIYLSRDCLGVEIVTAKCSSINVNLPVDGEEDGVFEETAMPEMMRTVIKGGKLVTTILEHVA